jgi:DNA-binding NarL/FixJ family response regulator
MNQPITVLIADDHPIFRKGLCEVISADPSFKIVAEACDGVVALREIETRKPRVAVLDIDMQPMSGLEVARAVRDRKLVTKLLMLTMHRDETIFNEAMNLGVSGYLLKENAASDLLTGIREVAAGTPFISPILTALLLKRRSDSHDLDREKPGLQVLTPTERRILKMIADDRTSKEIASDLGIHYRTVENHRTNICGKLGLFGSHSLLRFAFDNKARL